MTSISKPQFNLIEGNYYTTDYEEFKKDFLNPNLSKKDVITKHGLSEGSYNEYKDKVREETGISRKPTKHSFTHISRSPVNPMSNIRKSPKCDGWFIEKTIDGKKHYLGRYETLETAMKVRDIFYQHGWDVSLKDKLIVEYGITSYKTPALYRAMELYPKFEDLYLNSDLTIKQIKEKLGISYRVYSHLLKMIRKNHGILYRSRRCQ